MGDCSVGDFLLIFLLLAILHNGLSDGDSDTEVQIHRTYEYLQLYSKPTGNEGDTLIIGSKSNYESVKHVFPGFDHESCAPMKSEDYNVNKYGTNIFKRSNSNHFDVPVGEQLQEVKATDYFIQVGVQAFNCEVKKNGTEESKSYEKIVNSMSSIEDNIREIKYYSGVSVSIEECGGRKCIQVTETKCMADLENEGLVQFKCDYAIQRPANSPIIVPNMQVEHFQRKYPESTLGYQQYKRVFVQSVTISEEGDSFRIGINENPSGIVVSKTSTFPPEKDGRTVLLILGCQPPIIINTTIFHPECYRKVKNEGDNSFKDALLNDEQFRKSFTVVDQTVQICKEMKGNAPDSSPYARVFYRVQMTVIGKTKVNDITHGTGITELYSINLADGAVTVRYTDMRFYDAITRTSVDDLYYKNVFPSDMKVFITSNSAPVTHTPSDARATPRYLDVDYKLWPEGMIYSTYISGDGYNLQVGSKPKSDIDFGTASCKRVDYSSDHFKTELKIVAEKIGKIYAHSTEHIDHFSRPIQQQSWRCEYSNKDNEKRSYFTRVVNHLEILVPVHTLESYDGVEILRRPFGEKYILEIFEVKYLLGEHLTPMRATGVIKINSANDTDTAYAMSQGFNAISKNEVHPRFISQIPKRAHNKNDYYREGTINDHKTLKIDREGHRDEMRFTTELMEQDKGLDGRKKVKKPFTGLLVCTRVNLRRHEPYFEIFRDGHLSGNNNNKTSRLNEEYFGDSIAQEKWKCLKAGDTTSVQYLRITTKGDVIVKSDAHALKAIQFTPVDDVSLKLLESTGSSENSKYKITYEGVRYYNYEYETISHVTGEVVTKINKITNIDFGGYFILDITSPDYPIYDWRSGTINIKDAPSTSKEIVHKDKTAQVYYSDGNRGREYRFHLPGDQSCKNWQRKRMMRIGESNRVQQKIIPTSEALQCRENQGIAITAVSDNRLQMLVQTFKYSSQGDATESEQSYYAGDTRVWECTGASGQINILRVMNNFVFNQTEVGNIRTILYSDGIAIFGDGIAFFSGENNNNRRIEIAEVKFLNAKDYTNLKYEGALKFDPSSKNVGLHSIHLSKPEIQDVNYILNDNEFFKTTLPVDVGDTLEIGEPHPGMESGEDKEGTRFQTTIRCDELVKEKNKFFNLPETVRNNLMRPKVILLQRRDDKREIHPSTITDLGLFFDDIKQTIWNCGVSALNYPYYRVQTQMKLKSNKTIQQIFHQNGVKIYKDNQRHLIEITSYFRNKKPLEEDPSAFVPVKFEGLVILDSEYLLEKFMNDKQTFQNHLDKPIFQFSALSREKGVTYLVQSVFNSTIDNSDGEIVTCVKREDKNTKKASYMETKILVNEGNTSSAKIWQEVDHTLKDHILYESFEKWSCKYQENYFIRVVNKMLIKDNARVYYPDGVEVQRLILLDGQTFMQIKHVRFFKHNDFKHAFKYIGRLQLERETLPGLEKMLSSSPFNIQVMGKKNEEPSPYQPSYIFTLDSMRYAALLDLGKRSDGHDQSPPIKFGDNSLQTIFLNANSSRIFQLGRFWNKEIIYNSHGRTMKCYVYTTANLRAMGYIISPEDAKTKYNPRVAEYIDQKLYILTQDEFDEIFNIISVRTWLCTGRADEFLKVEAVYETTAIPLAVRFMDGVEVKLEKVRNKGTVLKIKETFYIDMMNSIVYKRLQNEYKQEDLLEFVIERRAIRRRGIRQGCLGFLRGLPGC